MCVNCAMPRPSSGSAARRCTGAWTATAFRANEAALVHLPAVPAPAAGAGAGCRVAVAAGVLDGSRLGDHHGIDAGPAVADVVDPAPRDRTGALADARALRHHQQLPRW
ncbi:hypothetical protein G6F46_013880 [Rhizopus delemar]|nr:hypothetical protein G6F46_013880 [Rhizopus delemar]